MQIDPVDHPKPISESSLESAATGQSEATTAEQAQWQATLTRPAFEKELAQGRENADPNTQARFAFGMQNGEKRVQPNEIGQWLSLGKVKPREAALILCLHTPIRDCGKTPTLFVTEIKAGDFEWLLRAFEDVAETEERSSSVRARTLLDWRNLARDRNLKYHPYFDQFEQAPALIDEVKPTERPQTTAPAPVEPAPSETPTCSPAETGNSPNSENIDSPPPTPSVREGSAAAVAVSAPSMNIAPAAEQQRITSNNNGQVPGGDTDAMGAEVARPEVLSVSGAPERGEPATASDKIGELSEAESDDAPGEEAPQPKMRSRTDGLRTAMLAGIVTYKNKHQIEPTARALFNWIACNDETGTIVEVNNDTDTITWKRSDGGLSDTTYKSFQGRCTNIKK